MNRHNICLLNDSFPPVIDGVANAVVNYASIIEQNYGHSVVVTPKVPGADDIAYGFQVVRYPSIDTRRLLGYVAGYPFSPEAANAIEKESIELLHVHCPVSSAILARQLAESYRLPLVMTWHTKYDIDVANAIRSKVLQESALQAMLRNVNACDEMWTVSHGAGENLKSLGFEGEYVVMPNGVDLPHERANKETVDRVTDGFDLSSDIPCFLFTGRLMWYKGLRIILDALADIKDRNIDFRMIFVGGGGDEKSVREYTARLGLDDRVIFVGALSNRDELRAWYSRADMFLFPSTFDTNGLVVREAAASDTASVLIEGSCAAEGIEDGVNGFLIEEDSGALASKLDEIIKRPELMEAVGRNAGRDLYISWDDAVSKAYDRYTVVIDNYKSGKYNKHVTLSSSWMQSQGELMHVLGQIGAAGRELRSDIESAQEEFDMSMRTIKNKAIVDAISTGYEMKKNILNIREEAKERIDNLKEGRTQ